MLLEVAEGSEILAMNRYRPKPRTNDALVTFDGKAPLCPSTLSCDANVDRLTFFPVL
jgi:hypothetical protein